MSGQLLKMNGQLLKKNRLRCELNSQLSFPFGVNVTLKQKDNFLVDYIIIHILFVLLCVAEIS